MLQKLAVERDEELRTEWREEEEEGGLMLEELFLGSGEEHAEVGWHPLCKLYVHGSRLHGRHCIYSLSGPMSLIHCWKSSVALPLDVASCKRSVSSASSSSMVSVSSLDSEGIERTIYNVSLGMRTK